MYHRVGPAGGQPLGPGEEREDGKDEWGIGVRGVERGGWQDDQELRGDQYVGHILDKLGKTSLPASFFFILGSFLSTSSLLFHHCCSVSAVSTHPDISLYFFADPSSNAPAVDTSPVSY